VTEGVEVAVVEAVELELRVDEGDELQLGAVDMPVVVHPPHGHRIGLSVENGQYEPVGQITGDPEEQK
jgi:hypothetical protein